MVKLTRLTLWLWPIIKELPSAIIIPMEMDKKIQNNFRHDIYPFLDSKHNSIVMLMFEWTDGYNYSNFHPKSALNCLLSYPSTDMLHPSLFSFLVWNEEKVLAQVMASVGNSIENYHPSHIFTPQKKTLVIAIRRIYRKSTVNLHFIDLVPYTLYTCIFCWNERVS